MNNHQDPTSNRFRPQGSFRSRLVLGNMLITILAILSMGFYVYFRAQQANDYLTTQLVENVFEQAQDQLTATGTEQTQQLNQFFLIIRRDISNLGFSLGALLSPDLINPPTYWDAAQSLVRLPTGSWDNSNEEIASVFIPAETELTPALISILNSARQIDFFVPALLASNQDVVAIYFGGMSGETIYYPNIDLSAIVPPDFDVQQRPWFVSASPVENPEKLPTWSDPYLDAALNGLVITNSTPVYDPTGSFRGVTAMDIQLNRITEIVADIRVGETGYAILLDRNRRVIAMPESAYQDLGILNETLPLGEILSPEKVSSAVSDEFWALLDGMTSGSTDLETITIGGTERFIIYQPVPEVGYSLAIIVPTQELLAEAIEASNQVAQVTKNTILISILLVGSILILALVASLQLGNRLTRPLISLTKVAQEISLGDLNVEAAVTTRDEIGALAHSFNNMTSRLRDMIENLENRVSERTKALEQRSSQIQAAAEVGNTVATLRNLDELLPRITQLISQRFNFYHVGIFLLDDRKEYAVLMASNSKGGQTMLARGHNLRVGQVGIVGHVTSTGNARIALDVGEDAVFFDNPDLPETRSEMALPLAIGTNIIGALDVQSKQEKAFSGEDIQTLHLLADQLAIAIENARLFSESQHAMELTKRAYGNITRSQWHELFQRRQKRLGMKLLPKGQIVPSQEKESQEFTEALAAETTMVSGEGAIIHAPIKVMGNSIGVIRLVKAKAWTKDEIETISNLSSQLGTALESARLYEQITDRALRETLVTDITSKIGSSIEMDTIMQTTVEEVRKLFVGAEIVFQLKKESGK